MLSGMTGQLQLHGDSGPIAKCVVCGVQAVGPCARCHAPLCGDCCVITDGGAKPWAICPRCAKEGGSSLSTRWAGLLLWICIPIVALALLLWLMESIAG
jgi:hypothetical protein